MIPYRDFFQIAVENGPYPYQERIAESWPAILEIPTGLGKTEATVLAWAYRRQVAPAETPRRLIYCLPMRTLVEQTRDRIIAMRERLLTKGVHALPEPEILMGGDVDDKWFRNPEIPAIIIGTQDIIISRALNRGYAMSRFQWPMTFGAINNNALWIIDEVQLQGVGAATAAQLQGLRNKFKTVGATHTTFMTATLDRRAITTPDYALDFRSVVQLGEDDLAHPAVKKRIGAIKTLERLSGGEPADILEYATHHHRPGTLTLIVLNTVKRAHEVHKTLLRKKLEADIVLLHSRFRSGDRARIAARLYDAVPEAGRIAVCTQVVEAGVDLNAALLISDLAPWSSMVQRFGRCNRNGKIDDARVIWLDPGDVVTSKQSSPYEVDELLAARDHLLHLDGKSVGPRDLPIVENSSFSAWSMLRRIDLLDLFDTSTDLMGHDVDVSAYIRDTDNATVSILWRDKAPSRNDPPRREEFCMIRIGQARDFLDARPGLTYIVDPFVSSEKSSDQTWIPAKKGDLRPGEVIYAHTSAGGYDDERGFIGLEGTTPVPEVPREAETKQTSDECNETGGDALSTLGQAITITQHGCETAEEMRNLLTSLSDMLSSELHASLETAALWHDVGKAHETFQATMRRDKSLAPDKLWAKSTSFLGKHNRQYFRHELVSALAFLEGSQNRPEADLIAYLIAAHHGKARITIAPIPGEQDETGISQVLGVRNGDKVQAVPLGGTEASPVFETSLTMFNIGSEDERLTWVDRSTRLRDERGPFVLAYLELLVRLADWRASGRHAKAPA